MRRTSNASAPGPRAAAPPAVTWALIGALAMLGGCSSIPKSWPTLSSLPSLPSLDGDKLLGVVTPYRIEIVQGNVLTKEQVALVKPGMPRAQVRDILGSPLLTDIFHADRWDYIFTIKRPGAEPQRRSVVARFDGDLLKSIDAPELPTEREFVAAISTAKPRVEPPVLELTDEQRKALPAPPPRVQAAASEPIGALRSYPPLEGS